MEEAVKRTKNCEKKQIAAPYAGMFCSQKKRGIMVDGVRKKGEYIMLKKNCTNCTVHLWLTLNNIDL